MNKIPCKIFPDTMAYVPVPKDLSRVKTKIALNLSKRQIICFSAAAAVGIPLYLITRGVIGNEGAVLLMIGIMLPFFFIAMYERDGQPAEKVLRNIVRARFAWPAKRPYQTENMYQYIIRGGEKSATKSKRSEKATCGQRQAAKDKQSRSEVTAK